MGVEKEGLGERLEEGRSYIAWGGAHKLVIYIPFGWQTNLMITQVSVLLLC